MVGKGLIFLGILVMSLCDHTFQSMSAQLLELSGHRPSIYKDYMEDNLFRAYEAVTYEGMSIH